jgi:photosystem II stability/assembly factor-like uncharacterized protein
MRILTCIPVFLFLTFPLFAQKSKTAKPLAVPPAATSPAMPESLFSQMSWRNVGPFRGGRSAAVTGVPGKPDLYYFGSTGGGIWRTQDGGRSWENISDGYFGGSIGAIEVAPSDHNVLYAGGGEVTVRGNVSYGTGMWKSEDAGRSWKNIGLKNSRHIPRVRVHPQDHQLVYAAVLGDLFKNSPERGIYRSKDGGKTWEQIHFVSENAGAVDLCMDPTNPRILYASFWKVRRTPYDFSSGGAGSSLWKSTDGGDTWTDLSRNEGMPGDTLGIIGITVSPVQPDRLWAIVESQSGGVFRSDDGGKKWTRVNEDRSLRQRAWYYSRIYADTRDADVVYVVNVAYHKSKDGGKTFSSKYAPHGDHHDLWIAPENPNRMIIGDDGGAQISYDGGATWTTYHNQPTAQFYRVSTDNAVPFRIYAAQQDNTTVRIRHRTDGGAITERDWEPTAGGESGHVAVDPLDNEVVYGGEYHGFLSRYDHKNNSSRPINIWPEDNMGHGAEDAKFRFQWNFPLFFSPHDPKKLYACSNRLHVTTNEGQSWQTISPDLTTNDRSRQKSSGGPITQDNTSVEYYCTIFAAAESPRVKNLIWTGSDDGLVHVTRDGGQNWNNVTPPALPKWTMVNCIEPDPFNDGGCYIACTSYKNGDYQPYLFYTADYGKNWKQITKGIDNEDFTRVVRVDPKRKDLLYCGTEQGMYISFDNGERWQKFQLNLPVVPITDLCIKDNHLIAATQGRALWIIDDLSPLHQLQPAVADKTVHFFQPAPAYRTKGNASKGSRLNGENRPNGVFFHFYLKNKPSEKDTVTLMLLEADGDTVKIFSNKSKENPLETKQGGNLFVWNMRYPDARKFDGMILWSYDLEGPKAVPGTYKARLQAGGQTQDVTCSILADPRSQARAVDFQKQFEFVQEISAKLSDMHQAISDIRDLRQQLKTLNERCGNAPRLAPVRDQISRIDSVMTQIEESLYQTKNKSAQDPLNFPVRLNDKLANLMGLNVADDFPPTEQSKEVKNYLFGLANNQLDRWKNLRINEIPALNRLVRDLQVDIIQIKK